MRRRKPKRLASVVPRSILLSDDDEEAAAWADVNGWDEVDMLAQRLSIAWYVDGSPDFSFVDRAVEQ